MRHRALAKRGRAVYLVGCSAQKLNEPGPARAMYTSTRFRTARALAERRADAWFILSAKHGLLEPDDVIEPYNLSLEDLSDAARSSWGETVGAKLIPRLGLRDCVVVLADDRYRSALAPALESRGCQVRAPLAGISREEQLRWLANAAPRGAET